MQEISKQPLRGNVKSPLLITPTNGHRDISSIFAEHSAVFKDDLLEHGAILFRGFPVDTVEKFSSVVSSVSDARLNYTYRSTPRTSLGGEVFTATEFPQTQEIPLHCENAYQRDWPMLVAFCCLQPATSGGATPIASVSAATKAIGSTLMDEFEQRKVKYVRHYRPYVDLPWETVFQTSDKNEVARFCEKVDIEHSWLDEETLRTGQVCQGVATHPITGEKVFFNQAHLFHVSSLGDDTAQSMIDMFGADGLPRQSFFGDGAEIGPGVLQAVRSALNQQTYDVAWERGDVLLLDNMQFAHGRRTFAGPRKIAVSLCNPYSSQAPS
jgi:alpha-ketoglutarate-dependent taurine dioxygenase